MQNLYPIHNSVLTRAEKERALGQKAKVIWLYGLSGAGKSTLANGLERRLHEEGFVTHLLDGDNLRVGLNRGLGFGEADRAENIRRVAEVAKLFLEAGVIVVCSFITPVRALRAAARGIVGADDFVEVYVKASWEICQQRDPKGLYAKVRAGAVAQFTGRDSAFEAPVSGDGAFEVDTSSLSISSAVERLHGFVSPQIRLS